MTKRSKPTKNAALTDLEFEAMDKSGELSMLMRQIIGDGPNAYHDWAEYAAHIHAIQNMILSQAAARAYPDDFRPLGGKLGPKPEDK